MLREIILKIFYKIGFLKPIFYINGPETLPPPLSAEEEIELLTEASEKSRDKLIVHNLRLVVYIARKFDTAGVNIEDLISIGTIGLIKAVNTFCLDRNIKLATYASRCIENEILMYFRNIKKTSQEISFSEPIDVDNEGNLVEGTMPDNGDTSKTFDGLATTSVDVPAGYTSGGTVSLTSDIEDALAVI